jgi:hypothetical protein
LCVCDARVICPYIFCNKFPTVPKSISAGTDDRLHRLASLGILDYDDGTAFYVSPDTGEQCITTYIVPSSALPNLIQLIPNFAFYVRKQETGRYILSNGLDSYDRLVDEKQVSRSYLPTYLSATLQNLALATCTIAIRTTPGI